MWAITLALLLVSGCARTATLRQPAAVSFAPLPPPDVEAAIFAGAAKRGWVAKKVKPGIIAATLHLRDHVAAVRITYDTRSFAVRYQSSQNLNYERKPDGAEVVHANLNSWMQNLSGDIAAAIQQQEAQRAR